MKQILKYITIALLSAAALCSCHERYVTYSDAEYVMFADTLKTYPVMEGEVYFSVPVVSTVIRDYDRTFGVEVVDKNSNAIENYHYKLQSNTITIKAGTNRADVMVAGCYDNISPDDSLGFQLQLIMNDALEMPLNSTKTYGRQTNVVLMKSCPFDVNNFTGYCVLTSMFLYQYSPTGAYQRLIKTEAHPTQPNTIICRNWIADGYDVTMTFHPEDPMKPLVTMDDDQVMSDEGSFFGIAYGDDKILVKSSTINESIFYSCGSYLYVWAETYVENLGKPFGTVGHFYNVMEWVSKEEGERLEREGL